MGNGDWRAKGKVLRRSARNWGDTRGAALGLADTRTRRRCAPRRARAETGWPRAATARRPRREVGEKPVARREVGEKPVARRVGEKPVARSAGEKPVARRVGEKPVAANGSESRSAVVALGMHGSHMGRSQAVPCSWLWQGTRTPPGHGS